MDENYHIKIWIVFVLFLLTNGLLLWIYFYKRKPKFQSLESFMLLVACSASFLTFVSLGEHGGFQYCYIARTNHSLGLFSTEIYALSIIILKVIPFWKKEAQKYSDWLIWLGVFGLIYLSDYVLGEYYFWHLYGPLPWHNLQVQ